MHFEKLNFDMKLNSFTRRSHVVSYNLSTDDFKGLEYFRISNENDHFFNIIPKKYRFYFDLHFLKINTNVWPHIDHKTKTSINFYIDSGNCKTTFYSFIDHNKTKTIPLDTKNLSETSNFIARDNDLYILDVTKPHSVYPQDNNFKTRTALCLQSPTLEYEFVLNLLKDNIIK
jgi:hypothetical protein